MTHLVMLPIQMLILPLTVTNTGVEMVVASLAKINLTMDYSPVASVVKTYPSIDPHSTPPPRIFMHISVRLIPSRVVT